MTSFLLLCLGITCAALLLWGFVKPDRMYQYPFLAGATFVGWAFPQLIGLSNDPYLPLNALDKTIFMTILCAGACHLGYVSNKRPFRILNWEFNQRRLLISSAMLSLMGAFFFFQISRLADEAGTQWSGIITVYAFFSTLLTFGLVVAIIAYFRKPSRWAVAIILFDSLFYLDRIIFLGRRADMAEFFLIITLTLWFHRRWIMPRWAMLTAVLAGTLVVNSIGAYRAIAMDQDGPSWSEIASIDFIENMKQIGTEGGRELTNAVYNIAAIDRTLSFDYGLSLWNALIFHYIPAQFLGASFKQSLMIPLKNNETYLQFYYTPHTGTTPTGMSDAFASFWYFGAVEFFLIAFIFSKLYKAAIRGHIVAQMLMMLSLVPALHAITHGTGSFFVAWPRIIVFLMPALLFARKRDLERRVMFRDKAIASGKLFSR